MSKKKNTSNFKKTTEGAWYERALNLPDVHEFFKNQSEKYRRIKK